MDCTQIEPFYLNKQSALQFLSHTHSHTDGDIPAMKDANLTIGSNYTFLVKDTLALTEEPGIDTNFTIANSSIFFLDGWKLFNKIQSQRTRVARVLWSR